jgi:hypothetical protein
MLDNNTTSNTFLAMDEFNQQRMQERMAYLSTQLAAHSAAAHAEMESSISDGIV